MTNMALGRSKSKVKKTGMPNIFEYHDFRAFLRDMYTFKKEQYQQFSYRSFALKAGFSSPNFLKLVMDGQRNLTNESVAKMAQGFSLKKNEREYLESLVFMNQAQNHDERNHYYQKTISLKNNTVIKHLEKASYEYFSKWYYPVIREIVTFGNGNLSAEQIALLLNPPITAHEAQKAITALVELDLIRKAPSGGWEQCDKTISTGPEVRSLVVANYHRAMLRMATESIERHPADQRDITALTLSISPDRINLLKERIAAFRRELLEVAGEAENPDRVIQINFQLFPVTKPISKEE
jgi:uncharacterized protein (TIGR02147 family)